MSWFRKKREDPIERTEVPFSTIMRWALYDLSVENPNEIATVLGLSPVSDEGHQKEEDDSEERLSALDEMLPFMDIISELNAKIVVATQIRDSSIDVSEDDIDLMTGLYKIISFSALVSAFSSGIQLGMLHTDALLTGSVYKEDYEQ